MANNTIKLVAGLIASCTLFLICLGGFVRATGAGLSCPDWPLCFGQVIPPELQPGVAQEFAHRVTAGAVSILSFILFAAVFRKRTELPRLWRFCLFLGLLLIVQIVFGGLTVLMSLRPFVVTTHLALGSLFFLGMSLIAFECGSERPAHKNGAKFLLTLAVLLGAQIVLGGFVGSSGASLACPDVPFCNGKLFPENALGSQIVQMIHRILGTTIFLIAVIGLICSKLQAASSFLFKRILTITLLLGAQITLGAVNVLWQIPIPIALMHLVVAELILLVAASSYQALKPDLDLFAR